MAFSPEGDTLALGGGEFQKPGRLELLDLPAGKVRAAVPGLAGPVIGASFSPDGKRLLAALMPSACSTVARKSGGATGA